MGELNDGIKRLDLKESNIKSGYGIILPALGTGLGILVATVLASLNI